MRSQLKRLRQCVCGVCNRRNGLDHRQAGNDKGAQMGLDDASPDRSIRRSEALTWAKSAWAR